MTHDSRRGLRHRCPRAELLVPPVRRQPQAVPGQHPRTPGTELVGDRGDRPAARPGPRRQLRVLHVDQGDELLGDLGDGGVRQGLVLAGPARFETGVLRLGGQQVAGPHVAGPEPLAPGHPLGGEERVGAGQQHRFVKRDVLGAGCPGDRHRPAPAPVTGLFGLEIVGDDPVPLGDQCHMLTHHPGRGGFLRRRACEVYRLGAQTVRGGGTGRTASRRRSTHRSRFSPYAVSRARQRLHRCPISAMTVVNGADLGAASTSTPVVPASGAPSATHSAGSRRGARPRTTAGGA